MKLTESTNIKDALELVQEVLQKIEWWDSAWAINRELEEVEEILKNYTESNNYE